MWMYTCFFPRYADLSVQVTLVAFNALNGLGCSGLVNAESANNANVALYNVFAVLGFFAGIATNKLGVRAILSLGGFRFLIFVTQGMVMLSYPTKESKGKYIAYVIALVQNMHSESNNIGDAKFYIIISLSLLETIVSLLLCEAIGVKRSDGSLFNTFNFATFNIRTRFSNNTLYWPAEIGGSYLAGYALDSTRIRRSLSWNRPEIVESGAVQKDFTDSDYVGPMLLYLSFGLFAAVWQTCLSWFLGALTNDNRKLTNFAGFYKGVQSAGGAISFRMNTLAVSSVTELVACWVLLAASLYRSTIIRKVRDKVE
ncbi:hypothetical protein GQ44DRAFT_737105 [Phaeosphaeriaceae sp. PMI808]|nr:hypothetical protein GQ44DRAFT_737105 [Phaeosphaeriaceae sp. PMI808]